MFGEPTFAVEIEEQPSGREEHETKARGVSIDPVEFGHVEGGVLSIEVHAVEPSDEAEWDEDGGHDCENLDDFVHAHVGSGEAEVCQ